MIKRISIWSGQLLVLLAVAAQAPAQEDQQSGEQQASAQQEQQSGQDARERDQGAREDDEGPRIYPNAAASLVDMGVPVIDVRSEEEIEDTGLLADATHIPHTEIDDIVDFIGDDTNRAVVLYCGSGRRAARAIENLRERGYHGMVNAGGYEDLREALEDDEE